MPARVRGAPVVGELRLARSRHFGDGDLGGEAAVGEGKVGGAIVGDGDAARVDGDLAGPVTWNQLYADSLIPGIIVVAL